jgi:hypothetical protein
MAAKKPVKRLKKAKKLEAAKPLKYIRNATIVRGRA